MSVDLTEVLERTTAPPMGVDPYAALRGGQRRRLRRRITAVGATLAVVAVAGVAVTFSPADRGTPTPAATTLTPDMVTAPLGKELWSFDLTASGQVQFGRVVQGTTRVVPLGSVKVVNGQAWLAPADRPGVVLGVLPADPGEPEDIFAGGYLGYASGSDGERLGNDLEVYVRQFDDAHGAEHFRGRVFTDAQGRLHGPAGVLPRARFGPEAAPLLIWVDTRAQVYGRTWLNGTISSGKLIPGVFAERDTLFQAGRPGGWVSGIAPRGTTHLRLEVGSGTTVLTPLEVKPLGTDHVAFAAEYRGTKGREVTITLRWTNADGSQGSRDL